MANLKSNEAIFRYLCKLAKEHIETEDDQLIFDALQHHDIKHACQAVREIKKGDVEFQHLTLRFGAKGEQSAFQFELSTRMRQCLDLVSLYLAIRQTHFELDTFHPDLISNVAVLIQIDTLLWQPGAHFLDQMIRYHSDAFKHVILSLQGDDVLCNPYTLLPLTQRLKEQAYALWFEMNTVQVHFEHIAQYQPDMIKFSVSMENKEDRAAFIPFARFLRKHRYPWIAGRVSSQTELNSYRLLGASYYFGFFSDIPTVLSFKSFDYV